MKEHKKNSNKVIAIVVTYNRKELLEESINSLLNQSYKDFDILIVDNNSTDGTYEDVVKKYESNQLIYANTGKNIGGAGGFNYGMRYALEHNYEFAWLMDDDSIPEKDALLSLINKSQLLNNEFSFLSSLCKWTDGSIAKMNVQVFDKNVLEYYESFNNRLICIERASFVSFFVNLNIARKVGIPYKEFFIYGDDWEYSLRLGKEKKGYLDLDSIVIHKMKNNKSANIFSVDKSRINRSYYNFRNLSFTYRKISKKYFFKNLLQGICIFLEIPFKSKNYRLKRMWTVFKGNVAGLFFNPKIEYVKKEG